MLEGCGWFSLLVGFGVSLAMGFRWLPDAQYVPMIGVLLSLLMMLCGRILFLRFLRKLAVAVEDKPSVRRAKFSLRLFITCWLIGLFGLGVAAGVSLGMSELTTPLAHIIWIVAAGSGLYGLILYDRLLSHLGRSVESFADEYHAEDERGYVSRDDDGDEREGEPAED